MARQRRCAEGLSGTAWATQRRRRKGKREVGGWKQRLPGTVRLMRVGRQSEFVFVVFETRTGVQTSHADCCHLLVLNKNSLTPSKITQV